MEGLLNPVGVGPPPIVEGLRLINGSITVTCGNADTAKWLEDRAGFFVSILESPLVVGELTPEMMPEPLFRATIWLHKNAPPETEKCFEILRCQNPGLDTSKWRIRNRFTQGNRVKVICSITKNASDFIAGKQGVLHFLSSTANVDLGNKPPPKTEKEKPKGNPSSRLEKPQPQSKNATDARTALGSSAPQQGNSQGAPTLENPYITNFRLRNAGNSGNQGREEQGHSSTTAPTHNRIQYPGLGQGGFATSTAQHVGFGMGQDQGQPTFVGFPGAHMQFPYANNMGMSVNHMIGNGTLLYGAPNWYGLQQSHHTPTIPQGPPQAMVPPPTGQAPNAIPPELGSQGTRQTTSPTHSQPPHKQ